MKPADSPFLDLATLVAHPERIADVPREHVPELMARLEGVRARLSLRWSDPAAILNGNGATPAPPEKSEADHLLTVKEAAAILGVDPRWLYRRVDTLPFVRRLSPRSLRFSERGLRRWMDSRR